MSDEAKRMILNMLSEGKITVEESEKLLAEFNKKTEVNGVKIDSPIRLNLASDAEEKPQKNTQRTTETRGSSSREDRGKTSADEDSGYSRRISDDEESDDNFWGSKGKKSPQDDFIEPLLRATKLGFDLRGLANTVQETIQEAVQKASPHQKEIKEKMKGLGSWMQELVENVATELAENVESSTGHQEINFLLTQLDDLAGYRRVIIENPYGDIRVIQDNSFKIRVVGHVNPKELNGEQGAHWFKNNAVSLDGDLARIGFDPNLNLDASFSLDIYLPQGLQLECKTVSTSIKVKGAFDLVSAKTVSGAIRLKNCSLKASCVETVSGNVQLDDCSIATNMKSTSGDFVIKGAAVEGLAITTVSGDIMLTESIVKENGEISFQTTSGDVIVERISGPWASITAISRTGDIDLDWKGELKDISGGSILRAFDASEANDADASEEGDEQGAEGCKFNVETVSGDIQFN